MHTVDGRYDTECPKRVNVARPTVRQRRVPNTAAVMNPSPLLRSIVRPPPPPPPLDTPRDRTTVRGGRRAIRTPSDGRFRYHRRAIFPCRKHNNTKYGTHRVTGIRTNIPFYPRRRIEWSAWIFAYARRQNVCLEDDNPKTRFKQRQRFGSRRKSIAGRSHRRLTSLKK